MQLTTKHYYDNETFEHVKSKFYINGEEVDFESYQDFISGLSEYNKDEIEKVDENPYEYNDCEKCNEVDNCLENNMCCCDECCGKYGDDERIEEFDYGELLEIFTKRIQDTGGCPECIKEILDEFADNFIEDYDEDCKCDECECNCKDELTDQQIEEIKLIEMVANKIENIQCTCGYELRDALFWLYSTGKSIGWNGHCCFIQKLMDDDNYKDNMDSTKEDINTLTSKIISGIKKLSINY